METCPVCKRTGDFLPDCPHFAETILSREQFKQDQAVKAAAEKKAEKEKDEPPEFDSHPRRDDTQHEFHQERQAPYVVTKRVYGNISLALQLAVIRPIGFCKVYYQHFEPIICRSSGLDGGTGKTLDPLMLQGYEPKQRFACFCFDRLNDNKLDVIDFPPIIHTSIGEWMQKKGITRGLDPKAPGMKEGPDLLITCQRHFANNIQQNVCWSVVPIETGSKSFTAEEMIVLKGRDLKKDLAELRRGHTPEEINAMLKKVQAEKKEALPIKPESKPCPVKEEDIGLNF